MADFDKRELEVIYSTLVAIRHDAVEQGWESLDVWTNGEWDGRGATDDELKLLQDKVYELIRPQV